MESVTSREKTDILTLVSSADSRSDQKLQWRLKPVSASPKPSPESTAVGWSLCFSVGSDNYPHMVETDLIEVLGNQYNVDILLATEEPKSAKQLSTELDVPIATCYRRIDQLEEAELLELHDRPLSDERRRVKVYRRSVENVEIDFQKALSINMTQREAAQTTLDSARQPFIDE